MRKLIFVLSTLALGSGLMASPRVHANQEGLLMAAKTANVYDFTMDDIDGKPVNLGAYKGKVLLLVNTASLCGNTPSMGNWNASTSSIMNGGLRCWPSPPIISVSRSREPTPRSRDSV